MPNSGALNQPKEKALTVAAANAGDTGCDVAFPYEPYTSDSIIPVQDVEHVENRRYPPVNSSHSESENPVSTHTGMRREQSEALKENRAFKSGNRNA